MPGQGRLGDKANVGLDAHGCPACPHPAIGPAIQGSPDVNVNRRPALRVDDPGIHAACCGANTWTATRGSQTVFINGKAAHRMGDQNRHCGGLGQLIEGSPNVIVGESTGGGTGGHNAGSSSGSGGADGRSSGGGNADGGDGESSSSGRGPTAGTGPSGPASRVAPPSPLNPGLTKDDRSIGPTADELTWVEIALIGEDGKPVPGERYLVIAPDGKQSSGLLDGNGRAMLYGIAPGTCEVSFPDLDRDAWEPING